MGNADGWLTAAAFHETARGGDGDRAPDPALSREHVADLARLAGSALLSSAFFLAPLVLPEQRPPLVSRVLTADAALAPSIAPALKIPAVRPAARARARRIAAPTRQPAPLLARAFDAPAPVAIASTGPAPAAYGSSPAAARRSREEGSRTPDLARLVLGDGRYRVQPFPTPAGRN